MPLPKGQLHLGHLSARTPCARREELVQNDALMYSARNLVLASASARRRQILSLLGIDFDAIEVDVDESSLRGEAPEGVARRLATAKALAGFTRHPESLVLGADTVVELDGASLGKPGSRKKAIETLERLRGRAHHVITAVTLTRSSESNAGVHVSTRAASTEVWMRNYTEHEIRNYVASGDPFDKAGSYAIQHAVFRPVERIEGCFLNVVGLPLPEVCELLQAAGLTPGIDARALDAACPGCTDKRRFGGLDRKLE